MSLDHEDFAAAVRISSLTPVYEAKKIRVAGHLQSCDLDHSMIVIEDQDTPLLVDISLCINGRASCPWLRERNTTVVAVGYLDVIDMTLEDNTEPIPTLILHALVINERRDLDLDVWNSAIDAYEQAKSKLEPTSVNSQ
ncbi:hypothetical protein BDY19DRAFT_419288 [Irpex rosettiformis]|uniref:Uncharacterized protein n=1 Tax=Irpex rosettiformis TaxID=378272 RepID=A0ACB8UFZ9_9APHY|nr:hypothetical protein BDY19DRAFT_419288 [Irpex rosettiformis]